MTFLTVVKLMNTETRTWNVQIIKEVMTESDAALVEEIPLSRKNMLDKFIWYDSIMEVFSIKYTYHVARRVLGNEEINLNQRDKLWK